MPEIKLVTIINSSLEICFDLSRSIELHTISTSKTHESAVAGCTKGLIGLNETVTWEAVHFGIKQRLTSKISAFDRPHYFADEQVKGAFKSFRHSHTFELVDGKVLMTDIFTYESPAGIFGRIFNRLVLTKYLTKFLKERNLIIKEYAESGKWVEVI